MKLAFSTVACPDWTLEEVAAKAAEMGYQGVELRTLGAGSTKLASDPALSTPDKIRKIFTGAGIEPICLSTSLALHHKDPGHLHQARLEITHQIEAAAEMGCPFVRIFPLQVGIGENRREVVARIAAAVAPLADKAGEHGVQLLFENAGSFCSSKEWWWLLDIVEHPMVGLLWNIANAAAADLNDRGGWVSVSTLNSRIRLAKVKDTRLGEGSGFCQLGDGDVGIRNFVKRLMGIGYEGYITVEWDRAWFDTLAPADEFLPEAHARLKGWIDALTEASAAGRKLLEKNAAKNAPKTRAEIQEALEKKRAKATA